jgi:hypothetical protein
MDFCEKITKNSKITTISTVSQMDFTRRGITHSREYPGILPTTKMYCLTLFAAQ